MNDLRVTVNGELRTTATGTTVARLIAEMGIDPTRVAVERNQDVVPRRTWAETPLSDGDRLEIVSFVGGGADAGPAAASDDALVIGGKTFHSRLLVGTGK
jgi:thiazole synthase